MCNNCIKVTPVEEPTPARLRVMTIHKSKGLEFDVVVLVEPARIAAESAGDLYVALTRPTQTLRVVAVGELPVGLS